VLFGLYDYKFEVLALLSHARHLDLTYKIGPHTISVPRIEPALEAPLAGNPPCPVSDFDFKKLVAILRLAVPYTGIILSTRETAGLRNELFSLGVSQISAGSRTDPGGYSRSDQGAAQFELYDNRSTAQVVEDILKLGYIPSFCTACYRRGRTGADFMSLAKPGEIRNLCLPNALLTFKEYLLDYGHRELVKLGEKVIKEQAKEISGRTIRAETLKKILEIARGKRDLYF
jgi:2-iminoacetate synthase